MFQSQFFNREFPDDNASFERIVYTPAVEDNRQRSLAHMRQMMLRGPFKRGIFIGGMEGVEEEYRMFKHLHTDIPAYPIASTGAAAVIVFDEDNLKETRPELLTELSYISLMRTLAGSPRDAQTR